MAAQLKPKYWPRAHIPSQLEKYLLLFGLNSFLQSCWNSLGSRIQIFCGLLCHCRPTCCLLAKRWLLCYRAAIRRNENGVLLTHRVFCFTYAFIESTTSPICITSRMKAVFQPALLRKVEHMKSSPTSTRGHPPISERALRRTANPDPVHIAASRQSFKGSKIVFHISNSDC